MQMGMAGIFISPVSSGSCLESRGQPSHPEAKAALTKPYHAMSPAKGWGFCSSTAATTQTSSRDGDPVGASFEILYLNVTLLEKPHQDPTQCLFAKVLRTISSGDAGDGLRLQGSPLCSMSGTWFPSKTSVCKAFLSGQTPTTGLFYQICAGIEFAV